MGGNALKKVIASRINLIQYNKIKTQLIEKFTGYLDIEFVIDVPNKQDFGDIDVLYTLDNSLEQTENLNIINLIKLLFNPVEIVHNGPVVSFAYELDGSNITDKSVETVQSNNIANTSTYFQPTYFQPIYFQVDLILCQNIHMSRFYFSYGDLGGIIGRLCQHIGLKYGSNGLWLNPNEETIMNYLEKYDTKHKISVETELITKAYYSDIVLLTDPKEICEFLTLGWDEWEKGFDDVDNIYNWVTQSKWFKKDSFRALNCEHRRRSDKRPMYQNFLKYIFSNEPEFIIEKCDSDKYIFLNLQLDTIEKFNKTNELENMILNQNKRIERKNKFSGKIFIDLGINGKDINQMVMAFKTYIEKTTQMEFENWLDLNDLEHIKSLATQFIDK